MDVTDTLVERGARYGDFADHARVAQDIKGAMYRAAGEGWERLPDVHKQALEVIADKIARVLTGDFLYADNFHDIAGYAKLVENYIESGEESCLPMQQPLFQGSPQIVDEQRAVFRDSPQQAMNADARREAAFKACFGEGAQFHVSMPWSFNHATGVWSFTVGGQTFTQTELK